MNPSHVQISPPRPRTDLSVENSLSIMLVLCTAGNEVKALSSSGFNLSSITRCSVWRAANVKPTNASKPTPVLVLVYRSSFVSKTNSFFQLVYLIRKFLIEYSNDCLRCIQMQLAGWNSHSVLHLRKNKHLCCGFLFSPQISPEVDNHAGHKPIAWR